MRNLLFLHALTGMHPGSGTALGVVDLPVQRERHTQWPTIPASSIKGVLRDICRRKNGNEAELQAAFGSDGNQENSETFAGALSFTDGRILAFPVRSMKGIFAWVTCPAVLRRLKSDSSIHSSENDSISFDVPAVEEGNLLCAEDSPLLVVDKVILEEFDFDRAGECEAIADWISKNVFSASGGHADPTMKKRLVVLHDDDFKHFVRFATEVVARIGLDHKKKTVKDGALFYQEFLPPETLLYSVVFAESSRMPDDRTDANDILSYLKESIPSVIQIGGDETTGKGLCSVNFI